jgi:hypothetical protein
MATPKGIIIAIAIVRDEDAVNLETENARLRRKLYDMMDKKSVEVFSAERAMDRLTNDVMAF